MSDGLLPTCEWCGRSTILRYCDDVCRRADKSGYATSVTPERAPTEDTSEPKCVKHATFDMLNEVVTWRCETHDSPWGACPHPENTATLGCGTTESQ